MSNATHTDSTRVTTERPCDILLKDYEAAPLLGVASQTLRRWRFEARQGGTLQGPRFIRIGRRCVRYTLADIRAYRDEREQEANRELGLTEVTS